LRDGTWAWKQQAFDLGLTAHRHPSTARLWPALSVRENLQFAAKLYLPGSTTKEERLQKVESVISELGLVSCADTM
jgi:ABC-type multidrug transport system ATPase subunit